MGTGAHTNRQLWTLCLITFINLAGFGVVLPVFPFFGTMVDASPAEITVAMAVYSLGQFIGAPLWGKLSDRYGRRPVLVISLLGAIASYLIMAYARDIYTLGASRLIGGLMAGNIAAAFAYVADITDEEARPKAMGMIGAAFGLGFIFGPAIGGLIAGDVPDVSDFAGIAFTSVGITLVALIGTLVLLPESLTKERRDAVKAAGPTVSAKQVLAAKPIVWSLMILTMLAIGSAALMESTFAFFAHDAFQWGPTYVGLAFAGVGVVSAALQGGAAGPLARRFGSGRVAVGGIAAHATGLGMIAVAGTVALAIAGMVVMAIGLGLFNPAFQTITSAQTNDADRGLVMGLTQGASSLGRVFGPAISGSIYVGLGMQAPFAVGALTMLVALGFAIYVANAGRKEEATRAAMI